MQHFDFQYIAMLLGFYNFFSVSSFSTKHLFMEPIMIAALAAGAYALSKKKKTDDGGAITNVSNPNVTPPKPGEPRLTVTKIHKILNKVDFTFSDGNVTESFVKKWKEGTPLKTFVGNYVVTAVTEDIEKPKKDGKIKLVNEGPINIVVFKKSNGDVVTAKRVLVNEKKVIDIK